MQPNTQQQAQWVEADGPNVPFSHMVVGLTTYCNGVGTAYSVGSLKECRE